MIIRGEKPMLPDGYTAASVRVDVAVSTPRDTAARLEDFGTTLRVISGYDYLDSKLGNRAFWVHSGAIVKNQILALNQYPHLCRRGRQLRLLERDR